LYTGAQTDTVVFNYSEPNNPYVFGNRIWALPPGHSYMGSFNPKRDTVFSKKDSSLYNGYLKMLFTAVGSTDTLYRQTSLYKVTKGMASCMKSSSFSYKHPDGSQTTPWKRIEGFTLDSVFISRSYYYSGHLFCEDLYLKDQNIKTRHCYDTAGTVNRIIRTKDFVQDGENYVKLNYCCGLTIIYEEGIIREFKAEKLIYFNQNQRIITADKFIAALDKSSKWGWGYQILNANLSHPSTQTILLYLTNNKTEFHINYTGSGITTARKKRLLKKAQKQN
jgi:hypothetical protein